MSLTPTNPSAQIDSDNIVYMTERQLQNMLGAVISGIMKEVSEKFNPINVTTNYPHTVTFTVLEEDCSWVGVIIDHATSSGSLMRGDVVVPVRPNYIFRGWRDFTSTEAKPIFWEIGTSINKDVLNLVAMWEPGSC